MGIGFEDGEPIEEDMREGELGYGMGLREWGMILEDIILECGVDIMEWEDLFEGISGVWGMGLEECFEDMEWV